MTDFVPQPDYDDELLSAYLDDELSADERARLESRLAADPAARRLLDELRAASQALRSLPAESVGYDLSESILARAEQAMLASATVRTAAAEPARPHDSVPQFTIGRTLRGWVWASAALAAGLLIMLLQPGDEGRDALPPVASRYQGGAEHVAKSGEDSRLELRSLDAPVEPADSSLSLEMATDAASPALTAANESDLIAESAATGGRAPQQAKALTSHEAEILTEERFRDRFAGTERGTLELSVTADADDKAELAKPPFGLAAADEATSPAASVRDDGLVVVHVVLKPSAIEDNAFDQLLTSNGIQIERPSPSEKKPGKESGAFQEALAENDRLDQALKRKKQELEDAEAVLVDAPAAAIEACLAQLKADKEHYSGVSVDDDSAKDALAFGEASPSTGERAKELATKLGRKFNRSEAPSRRNREAAGQNEDYYFDAEKAEVDGSAVLARGGGGGFGGGLGGEAPARTDASQRDPTADLKKAANEGRAFYLKSPGMVDRRRQSGGQAEVDRPIAAAAEPSRTHEPAATSAPKSQELRQKLSDEAAPVVDRLQVLFVLSREEQPTSSPANENRPQ